MLPGSWVQIILRGVGHAALHDPGEVDLRKLILSSVLYDDILLARVLKSKDAKRASERHQVKTALFDRLHTVRFSFSISCCLAAATRSTHH